MRVWPAPRHASQPPTVERSIDCGQWPTVTPCSARSVVLEPGAERPGSTSRTIDVGVDVDDPAERAEVEHDAAVQRHARAAHAAAARGRRDRDPRLVADAKHRRDLVGVDGRATTAAAPATWPSSAQIVVSGHQSRLASASDGGVDEHLAQHAPRRRSKTASSTSTRAGDES